MRTEQHPVRGGGGGVGIRRPNPAWHLSSRWWKKASVKHWSPESGSVQAQINSTGSESHVYLTKNPEGADQEEPPAPDLLSAGPLCGWAEAKLTQCPETCRAPHSGVVPLFSTAAHWAEDQSSSLPSLGIFFFFLVYFTVLCDFIFPC